MKPLVQISLDLTNIEEAVDTAQMALRAGVDWIEASHGYLDQDIILIGYLKRRKVVCQDKVVCVGLVCETLHCCTCWLLR